jgi:tetratricopeptide (TPR) repeat protein
MQGKSREAFQVLFDIKDNLDGYTFIRPLGRDIKNVPKMSNVIILFDDLFKFAESNFDLFNFLDKFKNKQNVIIVATCRSGLDYDNVLSKYSRELENFEKIDLSIISESEARELAKKTNITIQTFDGTPGSIILGLDRIKTIITKLSPEQKCIMLTIKFLAIVHIYFPKVKVIREVSSQIFKATGIDFDGNLTRLIKTGLIMKYKNIYRIWHDKYLEFIPLYFEKDDLDRLSALRNVLFSLKEYGDLISLSAWYGDNNFEDEVVETCSKAIELNPKAAIAYYNRGTTYSGKGNLDQAVKDFNMTIELDPNLAEVYCNRGIIYFNNNDFNQAIKDFTKAIEINRNLENAYYNQGNAYVKKGDFNQAIKDYNKAIELDPKDTVYYLNRGNTYNVKGDLNQAIKDYSKAIELDPNVADVYNNRGDIYLKKDELDNAMIDIEQVLKLNSQSSIAMVTMGEIYLKKEDPKNAKEWFEKALANKNQLNDEQIKNLQQSIKELN